MIVITSREREGTGKESKEEFNLIVFYNLFNVKKNEANIFISANF